MMYKLAKLTAISVAAALTACSAAPATPPLVDEDCTIVGDEDGNGLADCDEPVCAGMATCQPACGNGKLEAGEACDDGNTTSWDGCNHDCAGGTLAQQSYLKASNTDGSDLFGFSVALSADGSTLAVGAHGEGSAATGIGGNQADNSAGYAGAVYVFARSGTGWVQQAYLKASNTDSYDQFGWSVALSADGSTLAVGARLEDCAATGIGGDQADDSASYAGAIYVLTRSGATWSQRAYVKASNTGAVDYFGHGLAVSADGSTLAAGAHGEGSAATGIGGDQADNSARDAGAAYVFR